MFQCIRALKIFTVAIIVCFGLSIMTNAEKNDIDKNVKPKTTDISQLSLEDLLNQEISIATKKAQRVEEAPAIISVITKKEIVERGYSDIYDALTSLPGINAIETYLGTHQLFFRGIYSPLFNDKSLVLINGHPFWDSVHGSYFIDAFPLESIKQIEVIRGPGSTLYGTNAFAGVINIVTEKGEDMKGEATGYLRYGTGKTFESGVGAGNVSNNLSWNLNAAWRQTNGYEVENTSDEFGKPFAYESVLNYKSIVGGITYKNLTVSTFTLQQEKSKIEIIPIALGSLDNTRNNFWGTTLMADYSQKINKFSLKLRSSFNYFEKRFNSLFNGKTIAFSQVFTRGSRIDGELNTVYEASDHADIMGGIGFERAYAPEAPKFIDRLTGKIITELSSLSGNLSDNYFYSYLQGNIGLGKKFTANAGLRYVHNKNFGDYLNPRIGVVYKVANSLFAKALFGTAFRAATFNEKYIDFFTTYGNVDLKPEKLKTFEMGLDYIYKNKNFRVNFYYTLINDLIGREGNPNGSTHYVNLTGTSKYYGIETEIRGGLVRNVQFYLNGFLGKGKDQDGKTIPYIPTFMHNGGITYNNQSMLMAVYYNYIDSVENFIGPKATEVSIDSAFLLNAKIGFSIKRAFTISLIGRNITDKQVLAPEFVRKNIPSLQNGPGRSIFVEVRKTFN